MLIEAVSKTLGSCTSLGSHTFASDPWSMLCLQHRSQLKAAASTKYKYKVLHAADRARHQAGIPEVTDEIETVFKDADRIVQEHLAKKQGELKAQAQDQDVDEGDSDSEEDEE
eukprot:m.41852 g.41852  ORF g.41852 m.41852 type:complete len:113 (-) comp10619_c0_seq2:132-470(-)